MKSRNRLTCSLLSSAVTLALAGAAFGQAKAAGRTGLDALDESSVRIEMAARDMNDLLERSFEVGKVPDDERKAILAGLTLQRLANVNPNDLNAKQRRDLVNQLKGDAAKTIATMKDPAKISRLALNIMVIGVMNEISLIDFWGEDPATQAKLRPAAEAVMKLYGQAASVLNDRMNQLANQIRDPNDPRLKDIDKLQNALVTMTYSKFLSHYPLAMSLDPADPRRKTLADEAIAYLNEWDNPASGVQPDIKTNTGKMLIAKGDYSAASAKLREVWEKPEALKPAPNPGQISTARQFTAIAELLAGNLDAADKLIKDNAAWREKNITDKDDARLIADAAAVLQARVHWARADKATAAADKAKHNDAASAELLQLIKDRPQLAPLINEQIIARLPATVQMDKLDTLLLQAMVGRGRSELNEEEPDKDKLAKAIAAGKELLKRKGQSGVDEKLIGDTMIAVPLMAQKAGDFKTAAGAFLNYLEYPKADESLKGQALNAAMYLILTELKGGTNPDPEVADLYDRAMPIAINPPYNHKELAYAWARRMQRLKNTDEAIKYFRLVPANDPAALQAKYYLAIALNTKLDDPKLPAAERTAIASEIVKTAGEVDKAAVAGLANAQDDKQKNTFRAMLGGTKLTSAIVALDVQNDPKRALEILSNLEDSVTGMPGGDDLVTDAMGIRIRAHMAAGQNQQATDLLLDFVKKRPEQARGMVHQMNLRIGKEMDKAKAAGDTKRVAALAPVRAKLTKLLADWIRNNPDPKIKAQAFPADILLADVLREAALFEEDKAKRTAQLKEVAKIYEQLLAAPEAKKDPAVSGSLTAGLGLISYDTGDYQKCIDLIVPLLRDRRLGSAYMFINGQQEENPLYWEARFKVLRSYLELSKQKNDEKMKQDVANELRIIYSSFSNPGGQKWGAEFEKLRKEVDPTIDPKAGPAEAEPTTKRATDID